MKSLNPKALTSGDTWQIIGDSKHECRNDASLKPATALPRRSSSAQRRETLRTVFRALGIVLQKRHVVHDERDAPHDGLNRLTL